MPNRFPLSLKHLTIIVLGSDVAFNFVFSLNQFFIGREKKEDFYSYGSPINKAYLKQLSS